MDFIGPFQTLRPLLMGLYWAFSDYKDLIGLYWAFSDVKALICRVKGAV